MSHFYGGVSGQSSSDATRTGSKASGVRSYAQSWKVCGAVSVSDNFGKTLMRINVGPGPSSHKSGSLGLTFSDPEAFIEALGTDYDDRFRNKVAKIQQAIDAVEADVPRAIKSGEKRKAKRQRDAEAKYKREEDERTALIESITDTERRNYALLCIVDNYKNRGEDLTMEQASEKVREYDLAGGYDGQTWDRMSKDLDRRGMHMYRDDNGDLCIGEAYHCNNLTQGKRVKR